MPHGMPDWWGAQPDETVFGSRDVAEMAVRLGSIDAYNREGNVIYLDSFENALSAWQTRGGGIYNEVYPTVGNTMHGGIAICLHPGVAANGFANMWKTLNYPVLGGIGAEISLSPVANLENFQVRIKIFDGTNHVWYFCRYDHTTGNIDVFDSSSVFQTIGTPGIVRETYGAFINMKVVVNILNGEYVRVMFANHTYDASAYAPPTGADATKACMEVAIQTDNTGEYNIYPKVDDVIITQNEPVG